MSDDRERTEEGDGPAPDTNKPAHNKQSGWSILKSFVACIYPGTSDHDAEEKEFWKRQIRVATWLNGITAAGAAVGLLGLVILYFTLIGADDATTRANRAWIAPVAMSYSEAKFLGKDSYQVAGFYKNFGREPALNVFAHQQSFWIKAPPQAQAFFPRMKFPPNNSCNDGKGIDLGTVWPITDRPYSHTAEPPKPKRDSLRQIKQLLGVNGCYTYETFNKPHITKYCFILNPVPGAPVESWPWAFCPGRENNYAD